MLMRCLEALGGFVLRRCEAFGTIVLLYAETMRQLTHRPRLRHILAQMSHLGVDSLTIVSLTLLFTGVVGLVAVGDLPLWVAVFVIGRDIVLLGGNIYLRQFYKRPVDVIYIGKVATALFMTGFCFLLLDLVHVTGPALVSYEWLPGFNGQSASIGIYMVYVATVLSTITAVIYYRQGFAIKDRVLAEREKQAHAMAH